MPDPLTAEIAPPAGAHRPSPQIALPLWSQAHRIGRAAAVAAVAAGVASALALRVPLCPFAIITRHPCPGCGLTRAAIALGHGHLLEAVHLHPLSPVLVPLVVGALSYNALMYVKEGRVAAAESITGAWVNRSALSLVALVIAVWIARFLGAFGGPVPV